MQLNISTKPKFVTEYIQRKSLLYKTGVEYGDYTINHIQGCSHGCLYPCYAFLMNKRFGRIKSYEDWLNPKIVSNSLELLDIELPKLKSKIKSVHLSFTTDPFMYQYEDISNLTISIINKINLFDIPCTVLTKGVLPEKLLKTSKLNKYGITLISLNESFREEFEPFSAPYKSRIDSLKKLNKSGFDTWVSIEPYPTPNIIEQDFFEILNSVSFTDKIIFGRLNYNKNVSSYPNHKRYYNELAQNVIDFASKYEMEYHIKNGTVTDLGSN